MSLHHTLSCAEMRALISHRLDAASSQFETALAGAHLRRCAECSSFAAEVGAFTALIREAPLERVSRQVSLPRPARYRRPLRVARGALASAAVAVAAVGIGGSARVDGAATIVRAAAPAPLERADDSDRLVSIRELHREALVLGELAILSPHVDSLGVVKPVLPVANL